jgi:hypothetical protein
MKAQKSYANIGMKLLNAGLRKLKRGMKRTVEIRRTDSNHIQTLGTIRVYDADGTICLQLKSLELPWKDNQRKVSCIPTGFYKLSKIDKSGAIPYPHLWIHDVPNRDGIKIHKGNYHYQILGCVLPGLAHTDINGDGQLDVVNSTEALERLLAALPDETTIKII